MTGSGVDYLFNEDKYSITNRVLKRGILSLRTVRDKSSQHLVAFVISNPEFTLAIVKGGDEDEQADTHDTDCTHT